MLVSKMSLGKNPALGIKRTKPMGIGFRPGEGSYSIACFVYRGGFEERMVALAKMEDLR